MKLIDLELTYLTILRVKIGSPAHDHASTLTKLKAFGTALHRAWVVCFHMDRD